MRYWVPDGGRTDDSPEDGGEFGAVLDGWDVMSGVLTLTR
jgi:hypothetical protein